MTISKMTQLKYAARRASWDENFRTTVDAAMEEVKRIATWLEYVRDNEFSDTERFRLQEASAEFCRIAQPIANKYTD